MKTSTQQSNSLPIINQFVAILKLKDFDFDSLAILQKKADQLIKRLSLTVVKNDYYRFSPQGITLMYILSQSHLVFHSWPENYTIHIDLVSCTEKLNESEVTESIKEVFTENNLSYLEIKNIRENEYRQE